AQSLRTGFLANRQEPIANSCVAAANPTLSRMFFWRQSQMTAQTDPVRNLGPVSTVLDRIHPGLRRGVDRAILEQDPPILQDVSIQCQLRANGVSRSAFYRYAKRLRHRLEIVQSAEMLHIEGRDHNDDIQLILAAKFFEAAQDPETKPDVLHKLVSA